MQRFLTSTRRCSVVLASLALMVAVLLAPTAALAKSYEIADLRIAASFDTSGDLYVDELRTFDFSGTYSWVEWRLEKKGSGSIDVSSLAAAGEGGSAFTLVEGTATDPGTYSVSDDGSAVTVHAAIAAADQLLPMRLIYTATGAVQRFSDCGELYWQFVGDGWGVPTRQIDVAITPSRPFAKAEVLAWAHGPLTGVVAIRDDGTVTLSVADVPSETFVEARVLYPVEAVSSLPASTEKQRAKVMAEEADLANAANAERSRAGLMVWGTIIGSTLLSLAGLAFVIWAFLRHGREYASQFPGGYLREDPRPDLHPAVVGAVWRLGKAADSDIAATLMELADKKVITMRPVRVDKTGLAGVFGAEEETYVLGRVPGAVAPHRLDEKLMTLLFDTVGDGSTIDLAALRAYAKEHPNSYTSDVAEWKSAAAEEAARLKLVEPESSYWQAGVYAVGVVVAFTGIFAAVFMESGLPLITAIPTTIIALVLAFFMRRRSREGNELYLKYRAVRDFLRDFSRLNEAPPASVILWNRFLVLAVVFGIADEVIAQLRVAAPQIVSDPGFQTTYWWVYAGTGTGSPINSVQSGFASASQVATSAMSSASGGGGGFSGGGGGGGCGGGGGAG